MSKKGVSRRKFLTSLTTSAIALSLFPFPALNILEGKVKSRIGQGNLFLKEDRSLLVEVSGVDAEEMLVAGLEALGGLKKLATRSRSVLIKPNLVAAQHYPVISDPDFIFILARHCLQAGFKEVIVADISTISERGKRIGEKFETLGIYKRGKEAGVQVVCGKLDEKNDYIFAKEKHWHRGETVGIHKLIYNSPLIINTSVLKRHVPGFMSAALKNNFIAFGLQRLKAHQFSKKGEKGYQYFNQCLVEFADAIRPELTIIDARDILMRSGPTLGYGAEIKTGVNKMILSGDMVAIDTLASHIMEENDETLSRLCLPVGAGNHRLDSGRKYQHTYIILFLLNKACNYIHFLYIQMRLFYL